MFVLPYQQVNSISTTAPRPDTMGKKRPLSPSSYQPELPPSSSKQLKLDTFFPLKPNSNLEADSIQASPPPLDGLLDSLHPSQRDGGDTLPCGLRCNSAILLEKHCSLTADTVSKIFIRISRALDLLEKLHSTLIQTLPCCAAPAFASKVTTQSSDPLRAALTDVPPPKICLSSASTPFQLVYQARAVVISLHQTD